MSEHWSLVVGHLPHPLLSLALVGIAVAAVAEVAWGIHRRRRTLTLRAARERRALWAAALLRLVGIIAILTLGFELSLRVESRAPGRQRVAVLLDGSASMNIADATTIDATTTTRFARAHDLWTRSATAREHWTAIGRDWDLRTFSSGTPTRVRDMEAVWTTPPSGDASSLAEALAALHEDPPSAVVVVSDGLVAPDEAARARLLDVARELAVPITTADVGAPALVDISIADLRCGEFAFVENVVKFEVEIEAHGLAGHRTHVELLRDGEPIAYELVELGEDGTRRTVAFERAPDRVGQFVYEFRVPDAPGEATTANNRQAFVVNVLRDKVRVLHVAGRPNWDVRALRTLLKRDPNVELLSYYILRDWEDSDREDRTAKLSLIAFPTDELFYEQLGSFDLLVLHNFDAERYGTYLDNIASYVRDGGALVVIGGDLGLATGDYAKPQFASLLPIDTRRPSGVDRSPYRPQLTEAGRRHPITAWVSRVDGEWAGLPELDDFNLTGSPRQGSEIAAATLLAHPDVRGSDGQPAPLLAVAEPGNGRTMALATGASWRLGFAPELQLIDGSRPFDLLWLSAVRWLLRDASSERLILDLDRASYRAGDPITVQVRTLSPSYGAEPAITVDWQVRRLGDGGQDVDRGEWTTDATGRAQSTLRDVPVGAYEVTARRRHEDDTHAERARRVFLVEAPVRELARVDADPGATLLRELAQTTEGTHVVAIDGDALPHDLDVAAPSDDAQRGQIQTRRERPLSGVGGGWLALVVLTASLAGEWLLRRRYGLV